VATLARVTNLRPGDRIEYLGQNVFDDLIVTGDIGEVDHVEGTWVHAIWPRSGVHSVPTQSVRLVPPEQS
jgi:hypothetical protein